MNIKQIFLPLFGALALIGCNNEALEPTSSNEAETQPVRLALTMEATADASEMRAVSFDANQNVPPTTHDQYSDWTTHCFLRNADGSKKAYAVINWDATLEGGKVKLKMRGHELQLLPIGSSSAELSPENKPVAGERWSIVGITGGGKLNEERTRVDFAPDAELDKDLQPHQARVPFTFEKAYFTVSAASGERAPQISVHFEPQGALLNVYVSNKKNRSQYSVATNLQVVTNALSNVGYYDYSTGEAKWFFAHSDAQEEVLSRSVSIAVNSHKHYLFWGMPRPESQEPTTGFKSEIKLDRCTIHDEKTNNVPESRNGSFTQGLAYSEGIEIVDSKSPLNSLPTTGAPDYVVQFRDARGHLVNPMTFASASDLEKSGIYYTYKEAITSYTLGADNAYYLPTIWELGTIFPSQISGSESSVPYPYDFGGVPIRIRSERVQFDKGVAAVEVTADYRSAQTPKKIIYGIRFIDLNKVSGSNEKRTAFRYEEVKLKDLTDGTPLYGLKVTTRYLGNDADVTNFYTEDYWTDLSKNTQDITITIPLLGSSKHPCINGYYWSDTANGNTQSRNVTIFAAGMNVYHSNHNLLAFPLILFPRN